MSTTGPLLSAACIQHRVQEMGHHLSAAYRHLQQDPMVLVVMDGAAWFAADLLRAIRLPALRVYFVKASSYYGGTVSSGEVTLGQLPEVRGESVLVVDDIVDSGHTLHGLRSALEIAGAASIHGCCLLDKPARRACQVQVDTVGFTVDDGFLVGYGLDIGGRWRHLPDIWNWDHSRPESNAGAAGVGE